MPAETPTADAGLADRAPAARRDIAALVAFGVAIVLSYTWVAFQPNGGWSLLTNEPRGYYNLEVAGFRAGHFYMPIEPKPGLLALADPYDPVANAPYRVHDMSLYRGHYYMYFGVTPAIVFFWPVAALTGQYAAEPLAVSLFCSGAVITCMALVLAIRRRHLARSPPSVLALSWVCLALATPVILLLEYPQFYQVAISCALFLQALMLAAVYLSIQSRHRLKWLAAAGLLFGLSLGARPNYLLSSAALLVPVWFHCLGTGTLPGGRLRRALSASLAAFLPAAACAIALMAFNWARFGSPWEFGMHYALAGQKLSGTTFIALGNLGGNLANYLFSFGLWQSYFPFFSPQGIQAYGILRYTPWCWLAAAALLLPTSRPGEDRSGLGAFGVTLAIAWLANLGVLASFFATTYRYASDFAQPLLLLASVGALALGHRYATPGKRRIALLGVSLAAAVSLFFSLAAFAAWFPNQDLLVGISRLANWPGYAAERAMGGRLGAIHMEIRVPESKPVMREPLLETGRQPDRRDRIEIEYLPSDRARIGLFHAGFGDLKSREFALPPDRRLVVEASLGSLLPPFAHPAFSNWSRDQYDAARTDVRIWVNGAEVLRAALECYDSSPANLVLGRRRWDASGTSERFSGQILGVSRLALGPPPVGGPRLDRAAPVELTAYFPAIGSTGADPLLATGRGARSDLLYCIYDGYGRVRFALDHYGAGGPESESLPYDPLMPHTVVAWMGSLAGSPGLAHGEAASNRLAVIFDGRAVLNLEQDFFPGPPESAVVGKNAYGSTAAAHQFTGVITGVRQVGSDAIPNPARGGFGAIEMSVVFPSWVPGTQEPLVATGRTGAGDFVYVRYIDAGHVSFGFDHWGVGGPTGGPVAISYSRAHRIAITCQSLYPAASAAHASEVVRVAVDGRTALEGSCACHPAAADQVTIGRNTIGGSTCGAVFLGRILSVERFPVPRP
jgi:hypothetical protein